MDIITLMGGSGTRYTFTIYSINTMFRQVGGVYVFTRTRDNLSHHLIYIGETGDLSTRFYGHHKLPCIQSHNANRICVYREDSITRRLFIESDLLNIYTPDCNG